MTLPSDLTKDMKDTLFSGGYSLLLGAGASLDSTNNKGALPLGDKLRTDLIQLKNLRSSSTLSRAYGTLKPGEVDTQITDRFVNCLAGPSLLKIPTFNWRRIYTLNIDDALEAAYEANRGHQRAQPLTHRAQFSEATDIDSIQIVHIHGWAGRPEDGYVFSLPEYAGSMSPANAWASILAHTIATEPFIIGGTALQEPDLEYFLAGRQSAAVRRDRGPSFLIDPNPDAATEGDCERYGLHLYTGTLVEFWDELERAFPSRPLPVSATSELSKDLFNVPRSVRDLTLLSRDFNYVVAREGVEDADLSFFIGRKPTPNDIALGRDIPRSSTLPLKAEIRTRISSRVRTHKRLGVTAVL